LAEPTGAAADSLDLAPLTSPARRRVPATAPDHVSGEQPAIADRSQTVDRRRSESNPLLGTIVHRLFQRALDGALDVHAVAELVPRVVRAEEWVDVADRAGLAAGAAAVYVALRGRPDVVAALESGTCRYEVPISYVPSDRPAELVRAVVDCVVFTPDGGATILEFKTGARRAEHDAQGALYARAVAGAMGLDRVNVRILYP
jgi:hypothetical protein